MKNITTLITILCLFFCNEIKASGTYTVGTGQTYTTLKGAFDAINAGTISGTIVLQIAANCSETSQAVLNASGSGSASYTSVVIYPTTTATISGSISSLAIIKLFGADNVTIDGRINQTGSSEDLTIENSSATASTYTIWINEDATNNTIQYCTIKGSGTSGVASTGSGVINIGSTSLTTGNDNNLITRCTITKSGANLPTVGINCSGTSAKTNSTNTVSYCKIIDFSLCGFSLYQYGDTWTVTNNDFYQSASITPSSTFYFMYINDGSGHTITFNDMGGQAINCGGSAFTLSSSTQTCRVIEFTSSVDGGTHTLENNKIANITHTYTGSLGGTLFGCFVVDGAGTINVGSSGNANTIGATTGTGSITIVDNGTGTGRSFTAYSSLGTANRTFSYNTLGAISISGTNTASTVELTRIAANGFNTISYNTFGNTTANNITSSLGSNFYGTTTTSSHASGTIIQNNTYQNFQLTSTGNKIFSLVYSTTNSIIINFSSNATITNISSALTGVQSLFYSTGSSCTNTCSSNTASNITFSTSGSAYSYLIYGAGSTNTFSNNSFSSFTMSNSSYTGSFYAIAILSGNSTISGNTIGSASSNDFSLANNGTVWAIQLNSSGTHSVTNNTIQNWNLTNTGTNNYFIGINVGLGTPSITGNTITNITSATTSTLGLSGATLSSAEANQVCSSNTITAISASTTSAANVSVYGLKINGLSPMTITCDKNMITNLTNQATGSSELLGINVSSSGTSTYTNNVIILSNSSYTNNIVVSGFKYQGTGSIKLLNNTIYLSGATAAGSTSSTFTIYDTGSGTRIYKNNVAVNIRTGGTGTQYNYCYYVSTTAGVTVNNNCGYETKNANYYGYWGSAYNFANWVTNASATNDKNANVTIDANGKATNASSSNIEDQGEDLRAYSPAVTDDYEATPRADASPWIGAYEVAGIPLNIELIDFYAVRKNDVVQLNWKTFSEIENDYFNIERSTDGINFREIANINGAGFSNSILSYSFNDYGFFEGINYYKLKQTDFNGLVNEYSIISVDMSKNIGVFLKTINSLGQEVDENYKGLVLDVYSNGIGIKRIQ